ncbi:MAG: protein-disulfide reductase DsbD N-terminal domain-containing protein [bacterium]
MKTEQRKKYCFQMLLVPAILTIAGAFHANAMAQSPPSIGVHGSISGNTVARGRSAQAVVTIDVPPGFHVHSNRPLEKFLIATQLQVEAPGGVRVGPVIYPRPLLRSLKFSKNKVAVFEGRSTMRFNVTVPANFGSNLLELTARIRYQSCNDELCFAPQTREVKISGGVK